MICFMTARQYQPSPVGARIRRLRQQKGMTQAQLAHKMKSVQAIVSDIERGKLRPNPELLAQFAKAMAVSADELLGLKKTANLPTPTSRRILKRMKALESLPKRDQDTLLRTIDAFLAKAS